MLPLKQIQRIHLNVPQGVGDIFWIYQKVAPYVQKITFDILVTRQGDPVQMRAGSFLGLLPKVELVRFKVVPHSHYTKVIQSSPPLGKVLQAAETSPASIDYACNFPLENGTRLEEIDPGFAIEWNVPVQVVSMPLVTGDIPYICVYVSGSTRHARMGDRWTVAQWTQFILDFAERFDLGSTPFVFVGANYDREVQIEITGALLGHGLRTHLFIDLDPAKVLYLIQQSQFFIGYQSGLNILADNMSVPQVMVYFDILRKMLGTWCVKEHLGAIHHPFLFSQSPETVIRQIPDWKGKP